MLEQTGRLEEGERISERWEVVSLLGLGELAEVYEVRDQRTEQARCLKLYVPQVLFAPGAWHACVEEDRRVRALGIAQIVNIDETGVHQPTGAPFSVTERVSVPALDQLVSTVGALIPEQLLKLLVPLTDVLERAHAAGIVHRNLKPTNIFCSVHNPATFRLTDFSAQHLRQAAKPFPGWGATPGWLAPEAIDEKQPSTPQMDVYALGVTIFFALTGRSPYLKLDPFDADTFRQELNTPIRFSERARALGAAWDTRLDPWFERAMAPDPTKRFESPVKMLTALQNIVRPQRSVITSWHPPAIRAPRMTGNASVAEASAQPLLFTQAPSKSTAPPPMTPVPPALVASAPLVQPKPRGQDWGAWILAGVLLGIAGVILLLALALS